MCRVVLMSNNFLSSIENSLLPVSIWPGKLNYPCVRSHAVRACQPNCVPRGSTYTCAVRQWPLRLQTDSSGSGASLRRTLLSLKTIRSYGDLPVRTKGLRPDEVCIQSLQLHPDILCYVDLYYSIGLKWIHDWNTGQVVSLQIVECAKSYCCSSYLCGQLSLSHSMLATVYESLV